MADMQPTIESLRELNSRLVLKIDELRKKFTEIEAENTELKREKTVFLAKEAGLVARIVELEQSAKENVENSKLRDSKLNELRSRVSKLEQKESQNGKETSISKSSVNAISTKTENSNDVSSE
ncbi:17181_t:CDS:1, partial [Cetraspora pellucida]